MRTLKPKDNPAGSPTVAGWKLTRHAVETRALVQFGYDAQVWRDIAAGKRPSFGQLVLAQCIAKVTPPAGTSESDVLTLENALFAKGAHAVRRMPSPPEDKVVAPDDPKAPVQPHRTLLQVAIDRANRATSIDSPALVALVELAMSK